MNNWIDTTVDLGEVKEDKTKEVVFVGTPYLKHVDQIIPACGCTTTKFDAYKRMLSVTFKAGKVPKHLKVFQEFDKEITIIYKDGTSENLHIVGTKIRRV